MIVDLIRKLMGFVEIEVTGDFPERLLNQLAAHRVPFWNINRKNGKLTLCVRVSDYKKIHKIKGKNRVKTRVKARKGLGFKIKRYRLRGGLLLGAVFYFLSLFYLSGFIWNIHVVGNETIPTFEVLKICKSLGLYEGCDRDKIDTEVLRVRLAMSFDNIAWASVNIEGSEATVNISESLSTEKNEKVPCNLKATRDGIIEAIEANEGTVKVKVGQTVKAGEILVSGVTEYKDGSMSFGYSSGKVYARTNRQLSYLATFVQSERVFVGEPIKRSVLTVFGIDFPLYLGSLKGEFEKTVKEKKLEWKGSYLPIKITEATFKRVDTAAFEIDSAVAKELGLKRLEELELKELGNVEILSKNIDYEVTQKGVKVTGSYVCRENIAERDLLLICEEE